MKKKERYVITSAVGSKTIPATKTTEELTLKDLRKITFKIKNLVGDSSQRFAVPIGTVVTIAKAHARICLIDAGKEIKKCTTIEELNRAEKKWLKELNRIRKLYI